MKRSGPLRTDPDKARDWKRRSAKAYEDRVREESGKRFREIGVNRQRQQRERARAYGPTERREWLKSLPCLICGRSPVDQAHVETGGMSRKADADKVVPLCSGLDGHHAEHHQGAETFERKYAVDLQAEAERIDLKWRSER